MNKKHISTDAMLLIHELCKLYPNNGLKYSKRHKY